MDVEMSATQGSLVALISSPSNGYKSSKDGMRILETKESVDPRFKTACHTSERLLQSAPPSGAKKSPVVHNHDPVLGLYIATFR